MASAPPDQQVSPVGEEIHLPDNSAIPILMTVGVTLALLGVTIWLGFVVVGTVIFLWTLVRWIVDTRHDIDELPHEH